MPIPPAPADILVEVGAGVDVGEVGVEVVEDFRGRVDAFGGFAERRSYGLWRGVF